MRNRLSGILALVLTSGAMIFAAIIPAQQRGIDIDGVWQSSIGRTYIIRSSGDQFNWSVNGTNETAKGRLEGGILFATWGAGRTDQSIEVQAKPIVPGQDDRRSPLDISGKWRINVGREYVIEQSGHRFSWRDVNSGEDAEGTIEGDKAKAFWPKSSRTMSSEGRIIAGDRQGLAVRIEWSNGVVFIREPEPGPNEPERERRQPGQREGPPPPQGVQIGGTWYGNNKLVYDFIQHGNRFDWHASDGSKGDGFFTEDMGIRSGFAGGEVVPGRIVIGQPPGRAVVIEWQNGLIMTRGQPPLRGEERLGEAKRAPKLEQPVDTVTGPAVFDSSRSQLEDGRAHRHGLFFQYQVLVRLAQCADCNQVRGLRSVVVRPVGRGFQVNGITTTGRSVSFRLDQFRLDAKGRLAGHREVGLIPGQRYALHRFDLVYDKQDALAAWHETGTDSRGVPYEFRRRIQYREDGRLVAFHETGSREGEPYEYERKDISYDREGQMISYRETGARQGDTYEYKRSDISYDGEGQMTSFRETGVVVDLPYGFQRSDIKYDGDGQVLGYHERGVDLRGDNYKLERANMTYSGDSVTGYDEQGWDASGKPYKFARSQIMYRGDSISSYYEATLGDCSITRDCIPTKRIVHHTRPCFRITFWNSATWCKLS